MKKKVIGKREKRAFLRRFLFIGFVLLLIVALLFNVSDFIIEKFNYIIALQKARLGIDISKKAVSFSPSPDSPMGRGEHPRLHITQQNIGEIRNVISTQYQSEYQTYINEVILREDDSKYTFGDSDASHNVFRAAATSMAFVGLMNLTQGFSYPAGSNPDQLGRRAALKLISAMQGGQTHNYDTTLTYDWAYGYLTPSERSNLITLAVDGRGIQQNGGD